MLVPFENMPDHARVWIYQADRKFTSTDEEIIEATGQEFFQQWAAHGAPLKSAFKIMHNQFLILSVDETFNAASGCSIDSSVTFVKQMEQQLGINFFDRTKVAFVFNKEVFLESLSNIKTSVAEGKINGGTLTFNNLVSSKRELDAAWVVPAKSTWLGKYFN